MTLHTGRPGNIGKGSYGQFPGEADYRNLGLPRGAGGSTAWSHQGKAAEDRDSNRRPVKDSMALGARFHRRACTSVLAEPVALIHGFRTDGAGGHC